MFKVSSLLVFLCWLAASVMSAQTKIDSLKQVLLATNIDTVKVNILLAIAEETYLDNPQEALKLANSANELAEKINFNSGISVSLGWLAYLYEQKGEVDKATTYYIRSADLFEKSGNKQDLAICLNNLAAIAKDKGKVEEALAYNFRSLAIKKELKHYKGMPSTLNNIGLIYFNLGKISLALETYQEALRIAKESKNPDDLSDIIGNIGAVYAYLQDYDEALINFKKSIELSKSKGDSYSIAFGLNNIGKIYDERQLLDSALLYFRQSLEIREKLEDKQGIAYVLKNIGWVLQRKGLFEQAEKDFSKSLQLFESLGVKQGIAIASNRLGGILLAKKQTKQALPYLKTALSLSKALGYPDVIQEAANNLQQLYRITGEWKEALKMNDLYNQMRDSTLNTENRKNAYRVQFQIAYELKEAVLKEKEAIATLKADRQRAIILVGIAGFLILLFFTSTLFRQRNRITVEKERSESLLLNILPVKVAQELKTYGKAKAQYYESVTVMFTDFTNFTLISESLSPEVLVEEIHYCYSRFDEIMTKYGIEKIKTIGDSYMAASGIPISNNTHPYDMLFAAIEIQTFVHQYFKTSPLGHFNGAVRIGIHTGPVVAGIVGIKKFAYDIWGDTVNIAARIETACEPGKVNISGETYELIKDKFSCSYRGKVLAKNKGEVDMYFVLTEIN